MNRPVTLADPIEDLPLDVFELAEDGLEVESLTGAGAFAPGRTCCCGSGTTCTKTTCVCWC